MPTRIAAWLLAALTVAAPLAMLPIDSGLEDPDETAPILGGVALFAVVAALGLLVVERSPGRRIGLLLLGFAALLSLSFLSQHVTAAVILDSVPR